MRYVGQCGIGSLWLVIVLACLLCGCATFDYRGDYATNKDTGKREFVAHKRGKLRYQGRKLFGLTVASSVKEELSQSAKSDAAIITFLYWVAVAAFVGIVAGGVSWYLNFRKIFPCPWWDETLAISGGVLAIALVGIWWYWLLKWAISAGVLGFAAYRAAKGWKCRQNAAQCTETGILGRSSRNPTASTGANLTP